MTRVVVHAGFHKTGTTSAQAFLRQNGEVLWPVMALGLGYKFRPALSAARGYSTWRDPFTLEKFRRRVETYLAELGLGRRDLLISSEELCGHLPGRGEIADYAAAPALMREIEAAVKDHLPGCDLHFVFTLRRAETWWPSAYWEHVKSARMTLDYAAFLARYGALDLAAAARSIDVSAPVHLHWLEDIAGMVEGPAAPLLDLMDLAPARRAALSPVPPQNRSPEARADLIQAFLRLNRSDLETEALVAAKKALLDAAESA
ncbi:MAG: hypothetical protein AAGP08_12685 [Pseudomonadota bacterium]